VRWLQKTLVLAWLWLKSAKLYFASNRNAGTWHVHNQPHRVFITWKQHSLDPYGRNEMVLQRNLWCVLAANALVLAWLLALALNEAEICQTLFGHVKV
jgi:hypothetical protein